MDQTEEKKKMIKRINYLENLVKKRCLSAERQIRS